MSEVLDEELTEGVLTEVLMERHAQFARWGEQNYPDGTGPYELSGRWSFNPEVQKVRIAARVRRGWLGWSDILADEVAAAFVEEDQKLLRSELVQVAAVAVAWIEKIDRDLAKGDGS